MSNVTALNVFLHQLHQFGQVHGSVRFKQRIYHAALLLQAANTDLHTINLLGSGFKIAMRDLEIRGAGNLLGAEQHGHVAAVGFDLYCSMLDDAIRELKGEKTGKRREVGYKSKRPPDAQ